ncbi:uncharacterized protein [Clytia hemisphaerica]|uniref:uncharacterized protein n=1 Tax=Clytia hemisphaerica TaxID=252671 RepID=UPI0034D531CE
MVQQPPLPSLPTLPGASASAGVDFVHTSSPGFSNNGRRPPPLRSGNADMAKVLGEVLAETKKTNALLERILLSSTEQQASSSASSASNDTVDRADFMYDDQCLLDVPRTRKATKLAIKIAKILWTPEERMKGIIEPAKSNCQATEMDGERLALLKRLIKHHYGKEYERTWRQCRESINQAGRDLRAKERRRNNAANGGPDIDDDETGKDNENDFD